MTLFEGTSYNGEIDHELLRAMGPMWHNNEFKSLLFGKIRLAQMPENPALNCSATQQRLGVDRCCLSYEEKKRKKKEKEREKERKRREAVREGRSVICLHIVLHADRKSTRLNSSHSQSSY